MPIVPRPPRVPYEDDDVCPTTPFGPGKEWPTTPEITHGVGEYKNLDEKQYRKWTPLKHLHPGPLGFIDASKEG